MNAPNKLELDFRKLIIAKMGARWYHTIHVENFLTPGVPDLSFVMAEEGYETGWLELKAVADVKKVHVEPTQHRWMERHAKLVPAAFLINIGDVCYLVNGQRHTALLQPLTLEKLECESVAFSKASLALVLPDLLEELTRRDSHA